MSTFKEVSHNGTTIRFYPDKHMYINKKTGQRYKSVTQLLHSFKEPFDREGMAAKTAAKRGITPAEILKEWDAKGDFSRYIGTKCHGYAECLLLNQEIKEEYKPINDKEQKYCDLVVQAINKLLEKYEFVDSEKIVFSNKYMVAGTIDLLMKHNGTILLLDWKTNEEIKRTNSFQKMLGNLGHLDACNFNEYSLQLNCYRKFLLDEKYYDCDVRMGLIHVNPQTGIDWIKVTPLFTEVEVLLSNVKKSEEPDF